MTRVPIKTLDTHIDTEVTIGGWVDVRRDHGKLIFIDIRDGNSYVQAVVLPQHAQALEVASTLRREDVVYVNGIVNARPERMVKPGVNGGIELEVTSIEILSKAQDVPFEPDSELNLDTLLDYRPLTLRSKRERAIFSVQATITQAYRNALIAKGFTEFQAPALVGSDAEGGAEVFKVEYFNGKTANLATSPQFYKQIMVGPFERAFTFAKIFRAEKSATTRHLSEVTQMDFEMGFIQDHRDVMNMLEYVIRATVEDVIKQHGDVFTAFETTAPLLPEQPFPVFTLLEAQEIIEREFGGKAVGELDMEPEHERQICAYAQKTFGSDFVFITHFPTKKRAFYTYADPAQPERSLSFDLLFRGLEINSGSQRIHTYEGVIEKIKQRGMNPDNFSFYLQAFKYGMPPHGGCSTGLERFTARLLNLANVKEATAFPRDINRIDTLLSK